MPFSIDGCLHYAIYLIPLHSSCLLHICLPPVHLLHRPIRHYPLWVYHVISYGHCLINLCILSFNHPHHQLLPSLLPTTTPSLVPSHSSLPSGIPSQNPTLIPSVSSSECFNTENENQFFLVFCWFTLDLIHRSLLHHTPHCLRLVAKICLHSQDSGLVYINWCNLPLCLAFQISPTYLPTTSPTVTPSQSSAPSVSWERG